MYSLDCEMVYTVWGMGLARVTVVDAGLKTLMDALVLPPDPIVDCNTRFSGLAPHHFAGLTRSLPDVQDALLRLVSSDSILIGHSLQVPPASFFIAAITRVWA